MPTDHSKYGNNIRIDTYMKWRNFGFESPSGLHCTNRYESPDHLMGRSTNRQCIESIIGINANLLLRSSDHMNEFVIAVTHNQTYMDTRTHNTHTYKHTLLPVHTYTHYKYTIHTSAYKHTHTYSCTRPITTHIYTYTLIHNYYIYIPTHAYKHIPTHPLYTNTQINTTLTYNYIHTLFIHILPHPTNTH